MPSIGRPAMAVARIYLKEGGAAGGHEIVQEIVRTLHTEHEVRGVTVFRGIAGYGSHGEVRADDLLRMDASLPLVVEFFDAPEAVAAALASLAPLVPCGHVITWRARGACLE